MLRGAIVLRTQDVHKNPYITLFLHTTLGPDYYVPPCYAKMQVLVWDLELIGVRMTAAETSSGCMLISVVNRVWRSRYRLTAIKSRYKVIEIAKLWPAITINWKCQNADETPCKILPGTCQEQRCLHLMFLFPLPSDIMELVFQSNVFQILVSPVHSDTHIQTFSSAGSTVFFSVTVGSLEHHLLSGYRD